jgi:nucleoside-diphosphate-sugar epimerase
VNDIASDSKVLILGKKGRLADSLIKKIQTFGEGEDPVTLSSREMGSKEFDFVIDSVGLRKHNSTHTIFWCSGSASNRSSFADCEADAKTLRNFIELCDKRIQSPPNFIYFSSGGTVYGNSPGIVNELSPLNPKTHYAEMKVKSEEFLLRSAKEGRIRLSIFRLANLYGGKGLNGRKSLIESALTQNEIHLTVNPKSTKQYGTYDNNSQYVLDFMRLFRPELGHPLVKNVFSEHSYSIENILKLTAAHNPFLESRRVFPPADYSRFENVTLTSADQATNFNFGWTSLESHLEG